MRRRPAFILGAVITFFALLGYLSMARSQAHAVAMAKKVRAMSDIRTLKASLEGYRRRTGSYPAEEQGIAALVSRPEGVQSTEWRQFLNDIPTDPWGRPYVYRLKSGTQSEEAEVSSLGADGVQSADDVFLP